MSEHHDHDISFGTYLKVLLFLLFMTALTVATARMHLGAAETPIAMLIASIKAGFVLAYFMHLKHDSNMNRVAVFIGVFFLLLLFIICWADIITRIPQFSTL